MCKGWTASKVALPLLLACACGPRSLEPIDAGAGPGSVRPAGDGAAGAPGGGGLVGATPDGGPPSGTGDVTVCPPGPDDGRGQPPAPAPAVVVPTTAPISCAPLPESFIFPPPTAATSGTFSRCASFSVGAASAVSLSPDGRVAALTTGDGIVRLIDVGSQQVVSVLASPRAMIDYAAFAPDGQSILTLARAQREATLWRTADWTPPVRVWSVDLPGHRNDYMFGGGISFAPGGATVVVSPGSGVYLLDTANGRLKASTLEGGAILDVAFGLGGQRVVFAQASLYAHCVHSPNGGIVGLLNGDLQGIITLADFGTYPGWRGLPAFRVSPTDDLVVIPPGSDDPAGLRAFSLADGHALPPPAFDTLPLAFMPDGASVLVNDGGALQRIGVADGAVMSVIMLGDPGPLSISPDGRMVVFGGQGSTLLRAWRPGGNAPTSVCTAAVPLGSTQTSSLSADGQLLALSDGASVRVVRRADGSIVTAFPAATSTIYTRVELSPHGKYLAIAPALSANGGAGVFRIPDGNVLGSFPPETSGWVDFLFTPTEDKIYSVGMRGNAYSLDTVSFSAPSQISSRDIPPYVTLLGFSAGCPVLFSGERGAWRSCGSCDDTPIATGTPNQSVFGPKDGVLSSDGTFLAVTGPYHGSGVTLWRMPPDPAPLLTIPQRAEDARWMPQEFPVAIAPGAAWILTGAQHTDSCYDGPLFDDYLRDSSPSAKVLDRLPPNATSVDAALHTVAYGAQLWCSR